MEGAAAAGLYKRKKTFTYKKLRKQDVIAHWRIYRGDKVQILTGKDEGKQGKIKRVSRRKNFVWVEGLNLVGKHMKTGSESKGSLFSVEAPMHYSNVALVDPVSNEPTRIRWAWDQDGNKIRISKKSGTSIPFPVPDSYLKIRQEKITRPIGPKDTPPELVIKRTYFPPSLDDLD